MKRIVLALVVVAAVVLSAPSAYGHGPGHHQHGWNGAYYADYRPRGGPYGPGCFYPPPWPYYRPAPVPVAPVYPAYPVYPPPARQGFSYFSPGFSLSISR